MTFGTPKKELSCTTNMFPNNKTAILGVSLSTLAVLLASTHLPEEQDGMHHI